MEPLLLAFRRAGRHAGLGGGSGPGQAATPEIPSGCAGGRLGQEQAFLASYHVSKLQGFCTNNIRPCTFGPNPT